nr:hypothetical protein [Rhodoferax antarcticus]
MELSALGRENLSTLINAPDVKRISISGEGEPLNNTKVFHEILGLSKGGRRFEFITSGFFPHDKMLDLYETTNQILLANGDSCNIRLSADSHHIEKVKWRAHGFSLDYFQRRRPSGLSFSFRSIDTDRDFTRRYLLGELEKLGISARVEPQSILEDALVVGDQLYSIDYKNLVHPAPSTPPGYLDLEGYIKAIESKVNKHFTFGSLNKSPQANGLDVTIKPNGDVFLYGIESKLLGNIHFDQIDWQKLVAHVIETPLFRALYTQPLSELLMRAESDNKLRTVVAKVNNRKRSINPSSSRNRSGRQICSAHIPRQQRLHCFNRIGRWQVAQHPAQPSIGLQSIGFGRLHQ